MDSQTHQILHELRGHLGTVVMSLALLVGESEISEAGKMALKRMAVALEGAAIQVERLDQLLVQASPPA